MGWEDLNDHAFLRRDPLLATACDKPDPCGQDRAQPAARGAALAAPCTLNRLELSNHKTTRGHKLPHDPAAVADCLLTLGTRCLPKHAPEVVIDLDAMGHLLHGPQEGRHFSAYYDGYCYLPLHVVCGDVPLWAQLRSAAEDGAAGAVPALAKIVAAVRRRCPRARILVRADSGFCRDELLVWCEAQHEVYYCVGLPKNPVLLAELQPALVDARTRYCLAGALRTRVFAEFTYQTQRSWSRTRRVMGKAEVSAAGDNPRFVVTNLPAAGFPADPDATRFEPTRLYEEFYCGRGEMENVLQQRQCPNLLSERWSVTRSRVIRKATCCGSQSRAPQIRTLPKQQVLDLEADRMSTHYLASNQLRLWLATFAYLLLERMRAIGCAGGELARATVWTVRLKLLKVAAVVRVSVRRVWVQLRGTWAWQTEFRVCHARLRAWQAAGPSG